MLQARRLLLLLSLLMVGLFQNCSNGAFRIKSQVIGGAGTDGLGGGGSPNDSGISFYISYDDCGGKIDVMTKIAYDGSNYYLVRQNCQNLTTSVLLDSSAILDRSASTQVLLYNNMIFDLMTTTANQKVTHYYCYSANVDAAVWIKQVDPATTFTTVALASGQSESFTSQITEIGYSNAVSGGDTFSLNLKSQQISYSMGSQTGSATFSACLTQTLP